MTIVLNDRADFTLEHAYRVWRNSEDVRFSSTAIGKMLTGKEAFAAFVNSDRAQFIYGTTSAPGARAKERLSDDAQTAQVGSLRTFVSVRAAFGGKLLAQSTKRLIVFARLVNFIEGTGRVRPDLAQQIADLIAHPLPAVPLRGSAGPGEVIPLRSLFDDIADVPLELGEPMTLINGSPCATAFVTECVFTAAHQLALALRVFCLSMEAFGAPFEHIDNALTRLWDDPYDQLAITRMRTLLHDATQEDRRRYQAPVSWRIIPRVFGVAYRTADLLQDVATHALTSISDNPVFVFGDLTDDANHTFSTGGFYNGQAARAIDMLNAVYADLCVLCAKQTSKLLDGDMTELPPLLVEPGSRLVGTEFLAWMQNDFAERVRLAATPSLLSLGLDDPQGVQSDVASPVFSAYERHLTAAECLNHALAILSWVCSEALRLADRQPASELMPLREKIQSVIPHVGSVNVQDYDQRLTQIAQWFAEVGNGDHEDLVGPITFQNNTIGIN
ncbi:MAG: aromatic amino acid lyase [Chloroflexota bacterium]